MAKITAIQAQKRDPKRYLLYAILSHVTTDDPAPDFLAAHKILARIDFTKYRRFADYRVSPVSTSSEQILSAVYWNGDEALVLLANLSDQKMTFRWKIDATRIGWTQDQVSSRSGTLGPLGYRYVRIPRTQQLP